MRSTGPKLPSIQDSTHPQPARLRLDADRRSVLRDGRRIDLTAREFSLISEVVRQGDSVCPSKELFERVWNVEADERLDTLDMYVDRLRRKLGEDVIETVPGIGYRASPGAFERPT